MTELVIWNRALAIIGAPRVSSITELSSQKTLIDDHYDSVRRDFVELHPWDSCTTVVDLVLTAPVPATKPDKWTSAWDLPADFQQAWRVNDLPLGRGAPLWEVMALPGETPAVLKLFSDDAAAKLTYSFDPNSDLLIDLLKGTAQTVLSYRLAIAMARPWGKKEQDIRVLQAESQNALYEAKLANGRQQKDKVDRERPLVDARFLRF